MTETSPGTITIDGKKCALGSPSREIEAKLTNPRFGDAEIVRLRNLLVVARAARAEFARQLQPELPRGEASVPCPS